MLRSLGRHALGVAALIGIPVGAMFMMSVVLAIVMPGWDEDGCRWCGWVMGGAGIIGLMIGASKAFAIWTSERKPGQATDRRAGALIAGWFWIAICVAFILLPALVQRRWWFVLLGFGLAAPPVAAFFWATRSTSGGDEEG